MKLKGYNKYWNEWYEVYDFPFLRKDHETIHVRKNNVWYNIQIKNFCCFEREQVNRDSLKKVLEDLKYLIACFLTCFIYVIMVRFYHPILRLRNRLID